MYYVIQVKTSKEDKTIEELRRHLTSDSFNDIFSPKYMKRENHKGVWIDKERTVFPGYIFIDTDNIKEVFHQLYYVKDYTRLLGREENKENFLPLNEYETRMIDILYGKQNDHVLGISDVSIKEGMNVKVLNGPLFGLEGLIKKVNLHKRLVTLSISIGGRPQNINVSIDIVSEV